jgi:23S rRNA U2552 (ribose-2'-O)-methylase RlmE/FtsJ
MIYQHNFSPGKIDKCQICNSTDLIDVMSLGDQPLANTLSINIDDDKIKKFPINIVRCQICTLLQIDYIVNQNEVYHLDYPYLPGITPTVDNEQLELSDYLYENLNLKKNELVVDIGSNDGSLLKHFKRKGLKTIGVEPTNISKIANENGIKTIQSFFNKKVTDEIKSSDGKAKLITSTNVFAHMSSLGDVMEGITNLIDDDGYYAFENHYIMEIINKVQYDTFYHEHLRTYSLISLIKLFEIYGLCLFDAQIVSRYGGSIRCIVSKKFTSKSKRLLELLKIENKFLIEDCEKTYKKFVDNVINSKKKLIEILTELKSKNKKVIAKSCPARAVVLLNYCGLDNTCLTSVSEQPTSLKLNYYIPNTNLKITSDETLLKENPDYILLLAWHLSDPIIKKWKKKGLKAKFIVPLPDVQII